ncbi:hypothetical protein P3S68_032199 [Capsicum galapagoense]
MFNIVKCSYVCELFKPDDEEICVLSQIEFIKAVLMDSVNVDQEPSTESIEKTMAKSAFEKLQKAYVESLNLDTMFTPQIVVQGRMQFAAPSFQCYNVLEMISLYVQSRSDQLDLKKGDKHLMLLES